MLYVKLYYHWLWLAAGSGWSFCCRHSPSKSAVRLHRQFVQNLLVSRRPSDGTALEDDPRGSEPGQRRGRPGKWRLRWWQTEVGTISKNYN